MIDCITKYIINVILVLENHGYVSFNTTKKMFESMCQKKFFVLVKVTKLNNKKIS